MQTINPIIKRILLFKTAISPSLFGLIKQSDKKNPKINPPKCPKILISVLSMENTNKLIKIIEDYQLYIYDMDNVASNNVAVTPVSTASTHASANNKSGAIRSGSNGSSKKTIAVNEKHKVYRNNWARCVVARSGDSYASIALETGVLLKNLYKFNDLEADRALADGDVVYISRKRNVNNERTSHIVRVGESAWDIAQRYGIKVNSLYQMNGMEESRGVEVGQRLKLKR